MPQQTLEGYPVYPQSNEFGRHSHKSDTRYVFDEGRFNPAWKTVRWEGYSLPGQGHKLITCHKLGLKGCLNSSEHKEGKHFVRGFKKQCYRSSCPLCVESWANRLGNSSTRRIWAYREKRMKERIRFANPFHYVISFPEPMWGLDVKQLKKFSRWVRKQVGITGSCDMIHPWTFDKENNMRPKLRPHFHGMGFGGIDGAVGRELSRKYGIVVKKMTTCRTEGDVFGVMKYILSHAGVREKTHAVVYTGAISYSKLHVEKEPKEQELCPHCGLDLRPVRIPADKAPYLTGIPPPFRLEEEGLYAYPLEYVEDYDQHYYDPADWTVITTENIMLEKEELRRKAEHEKAVTEMKMSEWLRKAKGNSTLDFAVRAGPRSGHLRHILQWVAKPTT